MWGRQVVHLNSGKQVSGSQVRWQLGAGMVEEGVLRVPDVSPRSNPGKN